MQVVNSNLKTEIEVGKIEPGTLVKYENAYYIVMDRINKDWAELCNTTDGKIRSISSNEMVTAYKATIRLEGILNEV